ncbi:MAG: TetR family transcriptional regulator [Propionibacterium sp.]|nr:TetR family transcriptional regulator [Propionibacterium sp.]
MGLKATKAVRTRARILAAALGLFESQGYQATTVAQIAAASGVTSMTFFRHFPTKDSVVVSDPYDPLIAEAVAGQPIGLPALERVRRGFLVALDGVTPFEDATARRRVAVVAGVPELRGAMVAATQATQDAIVDRLVGQRGDPIDAAVSTAACLAAISAALLAWPATEPDVTLDAVVRRALDLLAVGGTQ